MKNITLEAVSVCILGMVVTTSCSKYDDGPVMERLAVHERELESQASRIGSLEKQLARLNTSIDGFGEMVRNIKTGITVDSYIPISDGSGCTLRFSDGSCVTIYDGQDGKDGKDGMDGMDGVPHTGISIGMDFLDGVLCWTVRGEFLRDSDGRSVPVEGRHGSSGNNGISPRIEIRGGTFWVTVDGSNWYSIGYATGEKGADGDRGPDGDKGEKGEQGERGADAVPFIRSIVPDPDGSRITFTFADGRTFTVVLGKDSSTTVNADGDVMTVSVGEISFEMIHVRHGTFVMGDGYNAGIWDASSPLQKVTISKDMWVARQKVQADLAEKIYGELPSWAGASSLTGSLVVTLPQGHDFPKRLSEATGIMFDIPTSAQWEWFATGGNLSEGHVYWGTDILPATEEEKRNMTNELGICTGGLELVKDGFFRFGTFGADPMLEDKYGYIDPFHKCDYQNGIVVRGTDIVRRRTYFSDYRGTFRLVSIIE